MNQKAVMGGLVALVLLLGGFVVYTQFIQKPDAPVSPYAYNTQAAPTPGAAGQGNGPAASASSAPTAAAGAATPADATGGRQANCEISIASWNDATSSQNPAQGINKKCTVSNEGAAGGFTMTATGGGTLMILEGERVTKAVMHDDGFLELFVDGESKYGYRGLTTGKFGQCYTGSSEGAEVTVCAS